MESKNIFFYPAIVASIGWCMLSLYKMREFINYLKMEYPECTMTNPNRNLIFLVTMIVLSIGQHPLEKFGKSVFMKVISIRKFPLGSE
jgi:hypothetical protein